MSSKVQKPCKTCGKMFTPCADCENDKKMFRWKKVACSPECAKKYFAKIEVSRQPKVENVGSQTVEMENREKINTVSENATVTEDIKPKRTRKKNIENKESEQIG